MEKVTWLLAIVKKRGHVLFVAGATQGRSIMGQEAGAARRTHSQSVDCGFYGKERVRPSKQAQGWLAWMVSKSCGAPGLPLVVGHQAAWTVAQSMRAPCPRAGGGGGLWTGWCADRRCAPLSSCLSN